MQTADLPAASVTAKPAGKTRRIAFRTLSGLMGTYTGFVLMGVPTFVAGWFWLPDDLGSPDGVLILHSVWIGLTLTVAYLAALRKPADRPALWWQTALPTLGLILLGGVVGGVADAFFYVLFGVATALLWALHPARARLLRPQTRVSVVLLPAACLLAAGYLPYAVGLAVEQHGLDDMVTIDPIMVAVSALCVVSSALIAALGIPGSRLTAWCAGLGSLWFGLASLVHAADPHTLAAPWAYAAALGGVAFIVAAEWERYRLNGDSKSY